MSSKYKLKVDLCRCCHSEGSFHSLSETVPLNDDHFEMYSVMLKTSLNVELTPIPGEASAMTFTICDACVNRLREAHSFKLQVELCEKRFRSMCQNIVIEKESTSTDKPPAESSSGTLNPETLHEFILSDSDDGFEVQFEDSDDDQPVINVKVGNGRNVQPKTQGAKTNEVQPNKDSAKPSETALLENRKTDAGESNKLLKGAFTARRSEFVLKDSDYRIEHGNYVCTHCEKYYEKKVHLSDHVMTKHYKIPKHQCTHCSKAFMSPAPLIVHKLEEHQIDDRYKCKACNAAFSTQNQRRLHFNNSCSRRGFVLKDSDYSIVDGNYVCTHCEKKYKVKFSLRGHVKTQHYNIFKHRCPHCGKAFMTPAILTVHKLEEHQIDDRYKCKACNAAFNTNIQFQKHINNFHMLGKKYKCESCEYETFDFQKLYRHKFKHRTEKNYHCKVCKKSFLRMATLKLHEKIHTGDRRKVCKVCGQAFVQKASLNYHMTKHHPEVNF